MNEEGSWAVPAIVPVKELLGGRVHVSGATLGEHCRNLILGRLSSGSEGGVGAGAVLVLDFDGIASATASFVRETVVSLIRAGIAFVEQVGPLSDSTGGLALDIYPVVRSLGPDLVEELIEVLGNQKLPCLEIMRLEGTVVMTARLLGDLEGSLRRTLRHVHALGTATAAELHERFPEDRVQVATVWNNRLNELHHLRLARRRKVGRTWVFEPLAKELVDG